MKHYSRVVMRFAVSAVVTSCLWAMLFAGFCSAQIILDGDFDHGGLDEPNSFATGNFVTLAGRDNFNSGQWKWLYFSARGVEDEQVTFQIDDNFNTGGSSLNGHEMVYSYDQETWHFFDNNNRSAAQDTFTFFNDSPFEQNEVWVAYGLPYSAGRVDGHTAQAAASPWVTPTASGNASLVIGQSPGGTDDRGKLFLPRDMYGYKISDDSATGPKKKIGLISGVHSNETLGNYMLEGLVNFLLSDDLQAAILRQHAEFYVYPMANPDGRAAGYNRSTVQNESLDPNRYWVPPNYNGLDDIEVVGDALIADTEADVDYFIDFHSTVNGKDGHFAYVLPAFQSDPFWQTFLELEPEVNTRNASLINNTGAKFGRDHLNAQFSITFETQFIAGENVDRFHTLGENVGLAFQEVFHQFGDLNFDGQLNEQDWLKLVSRAETDLSELSAVEAYSAGDLNDDGSNDIQDFGLFKDAYISSNGLEAFHSLFNQVPEPPVVWTVLTGILFWRRIPIYHSDYTLP